MATINAWNNQVLDADVILNGGTVDIGTDNAANAITIGTGTTGRLINIGLSAAAHTIVMGNTNTTTSMSLQSGTGNTIVNSSGTTTVTGTGGVSINSLSGAINVGDGANANAINIGTGAAARTITMGNTTGATAVNVDIGTGDFTLDSASGNIINARDSGEINYPLQPAFLTRLAATRSNVTGDGTVYVIVWGSEYYDQGGDFDNVSTFTAPVTGVYYFTCALLLTGLAAVNTAVDTVILTSTTTYRLFSINPGAIRNTSNQLQYCFSAYADMDAGDTCIARVVVTGGGLTVGVGDNGVADPRSTFGGHLIA